MTGSATRTPSWVLAVDFGTSSTAAAIGRDTGAELVGVDGGLPRMLSNVFWQESTGRLLLGDLADAQSAVAPWCFERTPKVKLGQQYMLLGDHRVKVVDAVGAILERVASDAVKMRAGERPAVVRLTHPVRWGQEKCDALLEAAGVAGLESPELVLEPVAAAMHYASERLAPGDHVAVYDLGGGTLDTAVLRCTDWGFEVVGEPRGRDGFGGEDFDHRLYRFLGTQLPEEDWLQLRSEPEPDGDNSWPKANRQFQRNVRRAKELLTHNPQVDVDVPPPVNKVLPLKVEDLERLISLDVEDSVRELERTILSAGLEPGQLAAVYLAGGSSQIPLVGRLIHERLGVMPQHLNDSKAVIALGAALGVRPRPLPKRDTGTATVTEWDQPAEGLEEPAVAVPGDGLGAATVIEDARAAEGTGAAEEAGELSVAEATSERTTPRQEPAEATAERTSPREEPAGATVLDTAARGETAAEVTPAEVTPAEVTLAEATAERTTPRDEPLGATVAEGTTSDVSFAEPTELAEAPQPAAAASELVSPAPRFTPSPGAPQRQEPVAGPPSAAQVKRRRTTALAVGGLVVVAAVALAVIVLSGGGNGPTPMPPTTGGTASATSGPLTISFAAPWRASHVPVPGSSAVGLALPAPGSSQASPVPPIQLTSGQVTLAAGLLRQSAGIPGGQPPQLVAQYGHPTSATTTVAAGGSANEYIWDPAGSLVVAFVVPTTVADAAIICQSPLHGAGLRRCTELTQQAHITGVTLLAPGPDLALGAALSKQLGPAVRARDGLHGLNQSTLSARAAPANGAAAADSKAASGSAALDSVPRYHAAVSTLVTALKNEANSFTTLARDAGGGHRGAYAKDTGAVTRASVALVSAANAFAAFGLHLGGLAVLHLAGPPAAPAPSPPSTTSTPTPTPTTPTPPPTTTSQPPPPPPPPTTTQCTQNCTTG